MIEVKNISKKFNNNVVLNGIDLNINKGDVVAIIGPSGTGKSTFLRCLNRLEKPESGSISIGDLSVDLARSDKKSLVELRKKTSMVFQGFNLFSKKTALENVMEGLIIVKKMDKKKAEEELARRNKTKVDIKSINSTTSKVNKKQARAAAKQNAAIEKENNAERYSSSKKMVIGIVLLVTCPIWLTLVGVILGVFALGVCAVAACIAAGIGCFVASLASIALTLLALFSAQISTSVFTLGCIFFLFAAGCGLCFLGYKLITRILPGAYFSVKVLFSGIKAKLARLALK